jgi:threonine/homoserine/homoserine lactone efflux protein
MLFQTWFAFFAAACLIAISPGSGAVLSMSHGLSYGVRRTSATILGLEIALVLILVIAGAGVGSLLVASEAAFNTIKFLGAAYLIYLGWSRQRTESSCGTGDAMVAACHDRLFDQCHQSQGHRVHGGGIAAVHRP